MKRDQNLVTLSWEHHDGLVVAFRLQQGLKKNLAIEDLTRYILFTWEEVLQRHFWQEEQVIQPRLTDKRDGRAALDRMMNDHDRFRKLIAALKEDPSESEQVTAFIDMLNNHIRFEERELFPLLEKRCRPEELSKIGDFLRKHHLSACADYPHKFWQKS